MMDTRPVNYPSFSMVEIGHGLGEHFVQIMGSKTLLARIVRKSDSHAVSRTAVRHTIVGDETTLLAQLKERGMRDRAYGVLESGLNEVQRHQWIELADGQRRYAKIRGGAVTAMSIPNGGDEARDR